MDLFLTFLRLGCTSFGGPVAHLGYFHREFVEKKKWLSESEFVDLVSLCQFLPGPASSQVGMAVGLLRAGVRGALLAWVGFTLPSAIIMTLFGLGFTRFHNYSQAPWIHGLKIVAVAVVAQAVLSMARKLCPDKERLFIMLTAAMSLIVFPMVSSQLLVMVLAGIFGILSFKTTAHPGEKKFQASLGRKKAIGFLITFFFLLIALPVARALIHSQALNLVDSFYRAGSLVFGGGHVVLPLLKSEVVQTGWVSQDLFMAGYGVAQAIPGPLFTFSAYLGAVMDGEPTHWTAALICLISVFLPSFLLIMGVLPFWAKLKNISSVNRAMLGINASVVGILLAALYHPVWTSAIFEVKDFLVAAGAFLLLEVVHLNTVLVILLTLAAVTLV